MKKVLLLTVIILSIKSATAQWVQIQSPYAGNLWSICFTDAMHGYAGGNTAILTTTNGGTSWTSMNTSSFMINDLSFPSSDTGYYGANNTIVGKTVNHGTSWSTIDPGVSPWGVKAVEFINSQIGWIGTDGGQVLKTTNGGLSWTPQSPGIGINDVHKIHFFDALTGILCAETGSVRRTINGGSSWQVVLTGSSNTAYDMFFVNSTTGFICEANGKILKSTDAGVTWSPLVSGTTQFLYSICFKNINEGYAGGAHGTLLHTLDGGNSWTPVTSSTTEDINDLVYTNGRFIGVCAAGKIITDLVTGIDEKNSRAVQSVYPNPCSGKLQIALDKDYRDSHLQIFNISGMKVYEKSDDITASFIVDTDPFPAGIYFYKLTLNQNENCMGHFVVTR